MVFPIRWPEPFGLVMVEAMACGTPVVTTNWGAAPELVDDGVTGFRRDGEDDLVEMVAAVGSLDPAACRKRVEDLFSGEAMVRGYEAVFRQLLPAEPCEEVSPSSSRASRRSSSPAATSSGCPDSSSS